MAPPHFLGSRIHFRYSALLLPKNPSLYVKGSAATASAITLLHAIDIAVNHHSHIHALQHPKLCADMHAHKAGTASDNLPLLLQHLTLEDTLQVSHGTLLL